jgi:hypothetical protein
MNRRAFITLLGAEAAWPLAARAQSDRVRRIGVLMAYAEGDPEGQGWVAAFREGLQKLGWTEGRNIWIDTRWTIPAFANIADPVGSGFVASFNRPSGNATGFLNMEPTIAGKWVELQASIAFPSLSFASALDRGRPCSVGDSATLVRDRRLRVRRVGRVLLDAADEIERGVQRLVVLRIRRDIGLRAGLLVAFGLKVSAQRRLAARVGTRFELLRHVLQHLDVGRDALRLDGASRRGEVARGCQPQRAIAGAERNDGLHRALTERARADDGRAPVILKRTCDNFGGRGRAAVDQHDERLVLGEVAGR